MYLKRMLAAVLLLLLFQVSGSSQAQRLGVKKTFYTGYGVNRVEYVSDIEPHPDGGWVVYDNTQGIISRYTADGKFSKIVGYAADVQGPSYSPDIRRILVDRQGFIYAFSYWGIGKFNPDGTVNRLFDGLMSGNSMGISDACFGNDGLIYVLEWEAIQVFTRFGNHVRTVKSNVFNYNIGGRSITPLTDGRFVLLSRTGQITVLDSNLREQRVIGDYYTNFYKIRSKNSRIFVDTNSNNSTTFIEFDLSLKQVGSYALPEGTYVDSYNGFGVTDNTILVADNNNRRLGKFDLVTGAYDTFLQLSSNSYWDHGDTPLKLMPDGTALVWNFRLYDVQKFDSNGNLLSEAPTADRSNIVDAASDGTLYSLSTQDQQTIVVSSSDGSEINRFTVPPASGFDSAYISQIAVDSTGNVLVAEYASKQVRKFSPSGIELNQFSYASADPNLSSEVTSLEVANNGDLYLLFWGASSGHIDVYSADGLFLRTRVGDEQNLRLYGKLSLSLDGNVVIMKQDNYLGIGYILNANLETITALEEIVSPDAGYSYTSDFVIDANDVIWSSTSSSSRIFQLVPIEQAPPRTEFAIAQYPNTKIWYKSGVDVYLKGLDAERSWGVAEIDYSLDGFDPVFAPGSDAVVNIPDEGEHVLGYYSVDNYGNTDDPRTLTIRIDYTAPVTVAAIRNGGTSVALTSTDNVSGVDATWYVLDKQTPRRYTGAIPLDGKPHTIRYWSVDNAGNEEQRKVLVTTLAPSTITVNPTSVLGGSAVEGRVTLNGTAGAGGYKVNLTSSNSNVVVPANVTVPDGQSSATFAITSKSVSTDTVVTITAGTSPSTVSAKLTLTRIRINTIALNPSSVGGGASSQATVTLNGPAPAGGATVVLQSNKSFATVPATVIIAAGQTTGTFTVSTVPVSSDSIATITAVYGGASTSAEISVGKVSLYNLTLSQGTALGGTARTATVTLTGPAPSGGLQVLLSSDNAAATLPGSVTVPANQVRATVTVTTIPVAEPTVVTITARAGTTEKVALLEVQPPSASVKISPSSITGGNISTGTITLNGKAPAAGLTLTLSSDDTHVGVPATVTVLAGKTTASFAVSSTPVAVDTQVEIKCALGDQVATTTINLRPISPKSVTFSPASVRGGLGAQMAVTLDAPAPATGVTLDVYATNSVVTVPATVTIPSGQSAVTVSVTTQQVLNNVRVPVVVTNGNTMATGVLTVTGAEVVSVTLLPTSVLGGKASVGTVTVSSPAPVGGYVVQLTSSVSGTAKVLASVIIPVGKTSITFPITTVAVAAAVDVSISGTLNGVSKSAVLKVLPPGVAGVTIAPTSVIGGTNAIGTVKLAVAPVGDVTVSLGSSLPSAASVPATVVVKKGAVSATFTVTTTKQTSAKNVTISASSDGVSKTGTITVK
jgi:hypothetical protein